MTPAAAAEPEPGGVSTRNVAGEQNGEKPGVASRTAQRRRASTLTLPSPLDVGDEIEVFSGYERTWSTGFSIVEVLRGKRYSALTVRCSRVPQGSAISVASRTPRNDDSDDDAWAGPAPGIAGWISLLSGGASI